ncbi:hypothetical protein LIER_28442 [Lithospermum erythrorhizon]|uniref:Uncharacterized protein n=1 Tax=Lithospermum erythrorhizon TaxID=34254 RepID=A0AAV3RJP8_LITER
MGATIPARIQPGSIDHVPFPTVVSCLGASLALREKARRRKSQDQSPGQTTLPQEELCYAPPIPIERKSCLVIPRLQHVRSLTPRAAAAVSRTDRRLTCTASLAAAKGLDVLPCYGSLRSKPGAALGPNKGENRAISRPFAIAIRTARLSTAWLRYRSYVVVDLKSSIPAIPECLLSSARSFARSKQDEVALLRRQGSLLDNLLLILVQLPLPFVVLVKGLAGAAKPGS